jgi:Nucleotidyl transferase
MAETVPLSRNGRARHVRPRAPARLPGRGVSWDGWWKGRALFAGERRKTEEVCARPWAQAYLFNGYWEDIGTIKSFFDANLALAQHPPRFEFYDPQTPIYTSPRFLPPAKLVKCKVRANSN